VECDEDQLKTELEFLIRDCHVPVYVGGSSAQRYRKAIEQAGAIALGIDLTVGLHSMSKQLPASPTRR
jgi:hypothetical protein